MKNVYRPSTKIFCVFFTSFLWSLSYVFRARRVGRVARPGVMSFPCTDHLSRCTHISFGRSFRIDDANRRTRTAAAAAATGSTVERERKTRINHEQGFFIYFDFLRSTSCGANNGGNKN